MGNIANLTPLSQTVRIAPNYQGKIEATLQAQVRTLPKPSNPVYQFRRFIRDQHKNRVDVGENHIPTVNGKPLDHIPFTLEGVRKKPPMTDALALSEIEEAKRILDRHYDSGFPLGIWHEQGDGISYRYAEGRYDELAQRASEGEAA